MKRLMTALLLGGFAALLAPAPTAEAACPTIAVDPVSLPNGAVTQPYSQVVTQTGGTGAIFSITSGVLPTGLAINGAGNITGTPTATGTFVFTATATDSAGCTGGRTYVVAINQAPAITSADNTTFQPDGTPKSFTVTTTGVPTPALGSTGTLPGTIAFTDNGDGTASIAGTPTAADVGAHPITITANNGVPPNATQNFTLNVTCPVITVDIPGANSFTVGQALAGGVSFTQTGGATGGSFAVVTGSLPSGVTLSSGGTLSGTPTQTGNFPVTVRYTAPGGCTGTSGTYALQVNCPTITVNPSTLTDALFGQAYGPVAFSETGSTGSSFTWTSTALPGAGLAFSTGGSLSGTPTNTGQANVTFTVTDNFSCQGQRTINGFAARPVANPDTFNNGVGNTQYIVAAADPGGTPHVFVNGNILTNDAAPPGARTSTPANPAVGGIGGAVTLATNGAFTYTPPLNATGAATFNYTLTDVNGITNTGLVTVNLANVVWYAASGGTGDGRSHSPLGSVGAAATAAAANHFIFVHSPSGTPATFAGAVTLKSGQTIWGQGTTFTLNGLTINPAAPTATKPVVQGTLNLATGVTVSSLDVSSGAASGIVGTGTAPAHLTNVTIKNDVAVTATTGRPVSLTFVDSTTGAGNGISFRSISSNGAPNGILLQNTTGNFTVTGDGGASNNGSGGTIQNSTQTGVVLTTATNVSLNYLNVLTSGDDGIHGNGVTNFILNRSRVNNSGNSTSDDGIQFGEASGTTPGALGTLAITNTEVNASAHNGVHIRNTTGTLASLTVTGSTFNDLNDTFGANAFLLEMSGTAVLTGGEIANSTFQNNSPQRALEVQVHDTGRIGGLSPATESLDVHDNIFVSNGIHASFTQDTSGNMTFKFRNNGTAAVPMTGSVLQAVNIFSSSQATGGTLRGRLEGNRVGNPAVAGSGGGGPGISAVIQGQTAATLLMGGNVIRRTPDLRGLAVAFRGPANPLAGTLGPNTVISYLTLTNNDVDPGPAPSGFPLGAVVVEADNQTGADNKSPTVRAHIEGNIVPATPAFDLLSANLIFYEYDATNAHGIGELLDVAPASANATAELQSHNTGTAEAFGVALIAGPIITPP